MIDSWPFKYASAVVRISSINTGYICVQISICVLNHKCLINVHWAEWEQYYMRAGPGQAKW